MWLMGGAMGRVSGRGDEIKVMGKRRWDKHSIESVGGVMGGVNEEES